MSARSRSRSLVSSRRSSASARAAACGRLRPLAQEIERLPPGRDVDGQRLAPLALVLGHRRRRAQRAQERRPPSRRRPRDRRAPRTGRRPRPARRAASSPARSRAARARPASPRRAGRAPRSPKRGRCRGRSRPAGRETGRRRAGLPARAAAPPHPCAVAVDRDLRDGRLDRGALCAVSGDSTTAGTFSAHRLSRRPGIASPRIVMQHRYGQRCQRQPGDPRLTPSPPLTASSAGFFKKKKNLK